MNLTILIALFAVTISNVRHVALKKIPFSMYLTYPSFIPMFECAGIHSIMAWIQKNYGIEWTGTDNGGSRVLQLYSRVEVQVEI